jgi:hypothetical protein
LKTFFSINFLAKTILSTSRLFHFFLKEIKIVVIIFACISINHQECPCT